METNDAIEVCTKALVSKTRLAEILGISRPTLYRRLRDNDFTPKMLRKLKKHGISQ